MTYYVYPSVNTDDLSDSSTAIKRLTAMSRRINAALNLPEKCTTRFFQTYKDASNAYLYSMSDDVYNALVSVGALTSAEQSSALTSPPSGFSIVSAVPDGEVRPRLKQSVFCIGDSITNTNVVSHTAQEKMHSQLISSINAVYGDEESYNNVGYKITNSRQVWNYGVDSGRFIAASDQTLTWDDYLFNLHLKDVRVGANQQLIFVCFLGTNDIAHSEVASGAACWDRAKTFYGKLKARYPNAKIVHVTSIARTDGATLNGKIKDYNDLARAEFATYVDKLADAGNLDEFKDSTLNVTTNTTYYSTDKVHPKPLGTERIGACIKAKLDEF